MKNKKKLVIISADSFGREVLVWARHAIEAGAPWQIKGFLDNRSDVLKGFACNTPILSSPEEYEPTSDEMFLCALGDPVQKKTYIDILKSKGARFTTLIHPSAIIGDRVVIGEGGIISPLTQLSCDIHLGMHVTFGTLSTAAHDTRIGDYSQISGGCQLNGKAQIGQGVFIGSNATLIPRVKVGDWAYVGAGSVVLKRVRPHTKVFGNPAIQIGLVGLP